jgi:hypothetical protein
MTGNNNTGTFLRKPHPKTLLAFLTEGFRIRDQDPSPPLGAAPVPITEDMSLESQSYWRRWNPALECWENWLREEALVQLRAAGMPEHTLAEPMTPEMTRLLDALVERQRYGLLLKHEWDSQAGTLPCIVTASPQVKAAFGAFLVAGGASQAAEYLNQGLPNGKKGLTRHHVIRARRTYVETVLLRLQTASRVDIELRVLADEFMALVTIYKHARRRPGLKELEGAALARAVHEHYDLHARMLKAQEILGRQVA